MHLLPRHRWVCERHPDQQWEGKQACGCGAAGAPCPWCNQYDDETPPRMPEGFLVEIDKDGSRDSVSRMG
jgi:hypothetical protein